SAPCAVLTTRRAPRAPGSRSAKLEVAGRLKLPTRVSLSFAGAGSLNTLDSWSFDFGLVTKSRPWATLVHTSDASQIESPSLSDATTSAGQAPSVPLQVSAGSHASVDGRQTDPSALSAQPMAQHEVLLPLAMPSSHASLPCRTPSPHC